MGDDDIFNLDTIVKCLPFVKALLQKDDDWFDRQNSRTTVLLLVICAIIITFYQFMFTSIVCWCPAHFTEAHVKYTNSYCWVSNTYRLPFYQRIPGPDDEKDTLYYYQWSAFILITQATLYFLPYLIWHGLNGKSGIDCDDILHTVQRLTKVINQDKRDQMVKKIVDMLDRFLKMARPKKIRGVKHCLKTFFVGLFNIFSGRFSCYLIMLFMFTKLLYITNAVGQFWLLNIMLFPEYNTYGLDLLGDIWEDKNWHNTKSPAFPRVTMCDMKTRRLGNVHRYSVQCTLPLNRLNEVIYLILWVWMAIIAALTIFGFLQWLIKSAWPSDDVKFIYKHVDLAELEIDTTVQGTEVLAFTRTYLKADGVFLLRLISHNFGTPITAEIVQSLLENWLSGKKEK